MSKGLLKVRLADGEVVRIALTKGAKKKWAALTARAAFGDEAAQRKIRKKLKHCK